VGWIENKLEEKLGELSAAVVSEGDKTRTEMSAALAQSVRGQRIQGALPRKVTPNATVYSAGGRLVGWSVKADAGPVEIIVHDGHDASGDVIAVIDLQDQENQTQWLGPGGISFVEGLYIECNGTGAAGLVGPVYLGAVD
jgi:hypothetical protein